MSGLSFLAMLGGLLVSAGTTKGAEGGSGNRPPKAPFRVLYSNDLTNVTNCPSPYNDGKGFSEKLIIASVNETAGTGIDVHMLQPGVGWEPWWPSKVYPVAEHVAWMKSRGENPWSYHMYALKGGDLVKVFIDECRKKGVVPFLSFRLNDIHNIYRAEKFKDPVEKAKAAAPVKLIADHPEYTFGPGMKEDPKRLQYAVDWAHPEVREFKFKIIEELCENYDFDGLELDFMRYWAFFHPDRTSPGERQKILAEFVRRVRGALDRTSKPGQHRWLCVRVPGYREAYKNAGINLEGLVEAGVDMVNLSGYYFSDLQMDLEGIRKSLPKDVAVYEEMHFTNAKTTQSVEGGKPVTLTRRTSDQAYYTAAHLAYARGLSGVSTFNFQYYRGSGGVPGEPAEPPFHIFKHLGDPKWLALQPQEYVVGLVHDWPKKSGRPFRSPFAAGQPQTIKLDMAPPEGGWKTGGRLRIQARDSLEGSDWAVKMNGRPLQATDDVSEAYDYPYTVGTGKPQDYRAWVLPKEVLRDGSNEIEITLLKGEPKTLGYMNLAVK